MKAVLKKALVATLPVMTGYLVLGFGFGIVLTAAGFDWLLALAMSAFIYAGSMQYAAIGLLMGGASLLLTALTTLMVNARHLFYGISMLEKYREMGRAKPYLIFSLTDETYSLVCQEPLPVEQHERKPYCFLVSLLDHLYWVTGTLLGAAVGALVQFNTAGIDFALTALFVTVFTEQWLTAKQHTPAVIGVGVTLVSLLIFGSERFLIPAMLVIALLLCLYTEKRKEAADNV